MVYQPTDTAQLGFSYSNVPTWRRDPSRIPSVPHPANFHNRGCPGRCGGYPGCLSGPVFYGGPIQGATCPTCPGGFSATSQPMPTPVAMMAVPSAPQVTPASQMAPVQPPTKPLAASPKPTPIPVRTISHAAPKSQPANRAATKPAQQRQQPSVRTQAFGNSRAAARRTTNRPRNTKKTSQKSGGWFGLPSLSEMKF